MSGYTRSPDPTEELARRINDLEAKIRTLSVNKNFVIPIVEQDPPESEPTNMWLMADGRLRARHLNAAGTAWTYREWVSTAAGSGTSGQAPAPAPAPPVTRYSSWAAIWTQSYRQNGAARTDGGAVNLYFGSSGDSFNGLNRSLIGFDYGNIASTLSGSTITAVSIRMVMLHTWYNDGAEVHFGIHNFTGEPGSWTGGGIPSSMIAKHKFPKQSERTVNLPLSFATSIRDGWGKGVALESPSTNRLFYGYAAGVGSGYQVPVLNVEYIK